MRFKVFPLRYRGRRLPWRDVMNGPSYVGDLLTCQAVTAGVRTTMATLRASDPMTAPLLPPLYEPELLSVAPLALRLRGIERIERPSGTYAVVQEWYCERA